MAREQRRRARSSCVARRVRSSASSSSSSVSATRVTTRGPDERVKSSGTVMIGTRTGRHRSGRRHRRRGPPAAGRGGGAGAARRASVNRAAASTIGARRPDRVDEHRRGPRRAGRRSPARAGRTAPAAPGWRRPRWAGRRSRRSAGRADRSSRSTGISSGVVTTTTPGPRRVLEDVEHPLRLVADQPDLDEIADHPRRADLGDDVPDRLGVDDHEVVVALAHLVGELADGEDLLDTRARRRRRSRTSGRAGRCGRAAGPSRTAAGTRAASPRCSSPCRTGSALDRRWARTRAVPASNALASAPLASISQTSVRRPCRAARSASAAAIVVLPTPPLPVTQTNSTIEERTAARQVQPPKPMRRSPSAVPSST